MATQDELDKIEKVAAATKQNPTHAAENAGAAARNEVAVGVSSAKKPNK